MVGTLILQFSSRMVLSRPVPMSTTLIAKLIASISALGLSFLIEISLAVFDIHMTQIESSSDSILLVAALVYLFIALPLQVALQSAIYGVIFYDPRHQVIGFKKGLYISVVELVVTLVLMLSIAGLIVAIIQQT